MTGNREIQIKSWKSEKKNKFETPSVKVRPEVIAVGQ